MNEFSYLSKSLAGALVVFISKLDGTLWLFVDYHELNTIMMNNQYSFLLMDMIFDRFNAAQIFTNIHVKNAHYHFQI